MFKRFIPILIAPLVLLGCGEEPTIQRYETALPVGYDWPTTEQREATYTDSYQSPDGMRERTWVWDVPAGWVDAPELPEQLIADYRFKGATESLPGRLTISKIDGDAGGINANVMRWLGQLYVTDARGLGPKDKVSESMAIPFGRATFVELHGQYQGDHYPTRISAAIVQIPAEGGGVYQTWFFKLAGDDATIEDARLGMARMILSYRLKGDPALPLDEDDVTEDPVDTP